MINLCREPGLPEPEFRQKSRSFVLTLWRNWLTDEVMNQLFFESNYNRSWTNETTWQQKSVSMSVKSHKNAQKSVSSFRMRDLKTPSISSVFLICFA
ncbi:MAG: hypothetical protein PVG39_17595 [Desulfobacteraceae bacterium]|jgi:hypothetical protein